jgi:hypothetical protein
MTDNGLAALAQRLEAWFGPSWWPGLTDVTIIAKTPEVAAAAILGERGVFLPDGLDGLTWDRFVVNENTIATLRAVRDAAQAVIDDWYSGGEIETGRTPFHDALRAALATAKETP